jgi:hemin uptake protein HemP
MSPETSPADLNSSPDLCSSSASPALINPIRAVSSEELLGARGELHIVHQGRQYRLRRTQNGKLILTA